MNTENRDRLIALERMQWEVSVAQFKLRFLSKEAAEISERLELTEKDVTRQIREILDGEKTE